MLIWATCVAIAFVAVALWYSYFVRQNRRRSLEALRWVEEALAGNGRVVGVNWKTASRLQAQLRLPPSVFHRASVVVDLEPREVPLAWMIARLRHRQELVTFEADLEIAPEFNLDLQNHRWCGRTQRSRPQAGQQWETYRATPFLITTRREWQRQLTGMMDALVASRERDFLSISYRKASPHFSASIPLASLSPEAPACEGLFDVLRELAGGASAPR